MISALEIETLPPHLSALEILKRVDGNYDDMQILPKMDSQTRQMIYPDYLVHHKFSIPEHLANALGLEERITYNMIIQYLREVGTPVARLEGDKVLYKTGMFGFKNGFDTAVRLWQSYKVENKVVYEVTIVGYP